MMKVPTGLNWLGIGSNGAVIFDDDDESTNWFELARNRIEWGSYF